MTQKDKMLATDCSTGGSSRAQRATNKCIRRSDESPSLIATGITTCRRKRRRRTMEEYWIPKMKRDIKQWFADVAAEEERFGCHDLPPRAVPDTPYEETPFGQALADESTTPAAKHVVSLALFDGDEMLFACSGVALPRGGGAAGKHLTRFLTSARLVREFIDKRNEDDKLRVEVRLPNNRATDGFLGLYDDDIAIVTTCSRPSGLRPVDIDRQTDMCRSTRRVTALGRAFGSGHLMGEEVPIVDDAEPCKVLLPGFTEAALGGPLVDSNGDFLGMIHRPDYGTSEVWALPLPLLRQRLMHFGIFTEGDDSDDDEGTSSSGGTKSNRHKYSLPSGVYSVVPSGFMRTINWLKSVSYPTPPPLMLELDGKLLNTFEDDFGEVSGFQGYEHNLSWRCAEYVWHELPKNVFTNISRRAVSVVSFKGNNMFFACTGLLVSWHERVCTRTRTSTGTRKRMRARSVILTSASLVRSRDDEDKIDENLRIEVFLPPNQRANGTLELYHLNYNIAIIRIEKHFLSARPENIFYTIVQKPFKEVVAIGRDHAGGLLLATMGEVTDEPREEPSELDSEDLQLSTCKIKKVCIGGPLINSNDGSFVGMNFYDNTDKTPFLPRSKIIDVLKGVDLPSQRGLTCPVNMMDEATIKKNRWPVPEAYWYHPLFDEDLDPYPVLVGRVLQ